MSRNSFLRIKHQTTFCQLKYCMWTTWTVVTTIWVQELKGPVLIDLDCLVRAELGVKILPTLLHRNRVDLSVHTQAQPIICSCRYSSVDAVSLILIMNETWRFMNWSHGQAACFPSCFQTEQSSFLFLYIIASAFDAAEQWREDSLVTSAALWDWNGDKTQPWQIPDNCSLLYQESCSRRF